MLLSYIFDLQRGATAEKAELGKMAGDERYDLWRKQGFICKPYTGEISDGARFISDYMEQAQKYSAERCASCRTQAWSGRLWYRQRICERIC